jgi:hypothetical protein
MSNRSLLRYHVCVESGRVLHPLWIRTIHRSAWFNRLQVISSAICSLLQLLIVQFVAAIAFRARFPIQAKALCAGAVTWSLCCLQTVACLGSNCEQGRYQLSVAASFCRSCDPGRAQPLPARSECPLCTVFSVFCFCVHTQHACSRLARLLPSLGQRSASIALRVERQLQTDAVVVTRVWPVRSSQFD